MPREPFPPSPDDLTAGHFLHRAELRDEVTERLLQARPRARRQLEELRGGSFGVAVKVPGLLDCDLLPRQSRQLRLNNRELELMLEALAGFDEGQLEQAGEPRILSIIQDYVRPSFQLVGDRPDFSAISGLPIDSVSYWRTRIGPHEDNLEKVFQSVGRIDVENHETKSWCGTGWLVRPDVLVTNRHVAEDFQQSAGAGWIFRRSVSGQQLAASLDYADDPDGSGAEARRITAILHIEPSGGPDVAFLRVEAGEPRGPAGAGIPLAPGEAIQTGLEVVAVGYPRYDSASPEPADLVQRTFGSKFNVKRASPGTLQRSVLAENYVTHDCSTLGRSSGSAIVELATGRAVGLHMGGKLLRENYAVPSSYVLRRLEELHL